MEVFDINTGISAKALIKGSEKYPGLTGFAVFIPTEKGTMVSVSAYGLPQPAQPCEYGIFAMHIHEGESCTGNPSDYFAGAKGHYNPDDCIHPYHAGDMPQLFANGGEAHLAFITDRFTPEEIIGRTIIIHAHNDDMHTQPSGNSGEKIACGKIVRM